MTFAGAVWHLFFLILNYVKILKWVISGTILNIKTGALPCVE